uniref:Fatty acid binding protein 5 n=1 Tax=Equus caballus TaxID=9796 RepID=F6RGN2_HORSE
MATIEQLVGRWRLVESKGFDEYMKEVGVGMALRKMGAMAKPDCIITSDGKNLTIKTESTLKTTQFSCNLGEKFEETTADGRKTQTVCNFTDGALVQHQEWDGKESTITRKLQDGKLVVVSAKQLMCSWVLFYIHSSHNCSISLIMKRRTTCERKKFEITSQILEH